MDNWQINFTPITNKHTFLPPPSGIRKSAADKAPSSLKKNKTTQQQYTYSFN